ncbi:hypothetical protein D3C71_1853360 [compost metagenome]
MALQGSPDMLDQLTTGQLRGMQVERQLKCPALSTQGVEQAQALIEQLLEHIVDQVVRQHGRQEIIG